MSFATPLDLLIRSNARRLAQLAVPADEDMVPLDAVRGAIEGTSLAGFDARVQAAAGRALAAINQALLDADALILGYGVPSANTSPAVKRLACTLAMYHLQGAERLDEGDERAYNAAIKLLKEFAVGNITFGEVAGGSNAPAPTELSGDVMFTTSPSRYGYRSSVDEVDS